MEGTGPIFRREVKKMKDFDELCRDFEKIDSDTYAFVLGEKAMKLIPALMAFSEDGRSGLDIFSSFIYASIAADGRLGEEEYILVQPLLQAFFGDNLDYKEAKKAFSSLRKENKEIKKITDEMVDLIGFFSEEMKADIIVVIMLICAVDGKISSKEKKWIKAIID